MKLKELTVTLRELNIGDKFISESAIATLTPTIFQVSGKCVFNYRHGSSTRYCVNMKTKEVVSKSCNVKVIKSL